MPDNSPLLMLYLKKCGRISKKQLERKINHKQIAPIPLIKIAFHPTYVHPLPENHRFPMKKYELIPQQLLYEGTMEEENFFKPQLISEEDILVVHCPVYWRKLYNLELDRREQIRSGFPHSKLLIERERRIASGTLEAAQYALK